MKLFISWSGEFSQKVAEQLSLWIPTIIQSVEVFYSPDDIAKGENWGKRLSEELDNCSFGLVCLTPENVAAPWIHFEAGALSKSLDSRVSAIMLNVSPSDIKGPLTRYQNTAFEREDFFRLFQSINNSTNAPLKPDILRNAFDHAWESLRADIEDIIKQYANSIKSPPAVRERGNSDSDAIQEILRLVRRMDSSQAKSAPISPVVLDLDNASVGVHVAIDDSIDVFQALDIIKEYASPDDIYSIRQQLKLSSMAEFAVPLYKVSKLQSRLKNIGVSLDF